MPTLRDILDARVVEADPALWETIDPGSSVRAKTEANSPGHARVRCFACGHCCPIAEGQRGVCQVRFNRGGKLYVPYGYVAGVQCDPIEKKPFFHAMPGALAYSFGMLGCDLHCSYCQNWVTSQALRDPEAVSPPLPADPARLVKDALAQGARVVVSTYNEPLITSEWAVDVFREARAAGLLTAYVSNGNGTPQVLKYLEPWIDLYKVDLKSFDDRHYRQLGGRIEPILETIRALHGMGIWLELVTLLIPGFNDSDDELRRLTEFVAGVSIDIPWHVTAFHQDYKMTSPNDTRPDDLVRAARIGRNAGLRYVYAGNLPGRVSGLENTHCYQCGAMLIRRVGYWIEEYRLTPDGACPDCGSVIPGRWSRQFGGQIAATPFLPRSRSRLVKILERQ
ncbi:MAG TPA: AmmeMemoRadiSam system radical SAM enzyme [Terriglobales bacterium]|nr:AmmeMemoRadiSam system radical SAM enzyme [Terriglobales bacterium]